MYAAVVGILHRVRRRVVVDNARESSFWALILAVALAVATLIAVLYVTVDDRDDKAPPPYTYPLF